MKKGLVLEGGAMRGMFSCGVPDVFMENGIAFDGVIGVSAGATFGCNIKSNQQGRAIRYNLRFAGDKRYCSVKNIFRGEDIFPKKFCYETLPNELDIFDYKTFAENSLQFYCVVSDCKKGIPLVKELKSCKNGEMDFLRASASMPIVSKPVKIGDNFYLDGGMTSSIPLKQFEELGFSKNIVVLTQPKDFLKEKSKSILLMKMLLKKFPLLVKAMENRHITYNNEKKYAFEQEKNGLSLVLCPEKPLGISRLEKNKDELKRVYEEGRKVALKNLQKIKQFLQ